MALTGDQFACLERIIREQKAHLRAALPELDAALARMAEATYGACIDCGRDIDFERLIAHPSALRCFDCQEVYERTAGPPAAPDL